MLVLLPGDRQGEKGICRCSQLCQDPLLHGLANSGLAINRVVGLSMPPAGPRAEHSAPGHMAKEKHGTDETKVKEPPTPQPVLSPAPCGFCSACTACFGLAALLGLFWADAASKLRSDVALGIQTCICHGGSTTNSQLYQ